MLVLLFPGEFKGTALSEWKYVGFKVGENANAEEINLRLLNSKEGALKPLYYV